MKTLKKLTALLLAAALVTSLLWGCGKSSGGTEKETEKIEKPAALPAFEPLDWSGVKESSYEDFTYELRDGTDPVTGEYSKVVRLLSYTGSDTIIKIPDQIEGYYGDRRKFCVIDKV